jgi:hypothetical protein
MRIANASRAYFRCTPAIPIATGISPTAGQTPGITNVFDVQVETPPIDQGYGCTEAAGSIQGGLEPRISRGVAPFTIYNRAQQAGTCREKNNSDWLPVQKALMLRFSAAGGCCRQASTWSRNSRKEFQPRMTRISRINPCHPWFSSSFLRS